MQYIVNVNVFKVYKGIVWYVRNNTKQGTRRQLVATW